MTGAGRPLAGRRIALLPRYEREGPSSRLRMYQFVPWLEAAGATVSVHPFFDAHYLAGYFNSGRKSRRGALAAHARRVAAMPAIAHADLAWVEKELFPFLPAVAERALAVAVAGVPYVVDYDDATFHGYDGHRSAIVRRLFGCKLDPLLRRATLVTAGNAYLAGYARDHGAGRIEIVPTVVDTARYPVLPPPNGAELRVGWIGTPANARYLAPVVAALAALARERPVRLVTIGADAIPGLAFPQERHAWSEATEAHLLAGIDIGVMPLPDAPWERGKCAYKLIQYMAAGRPVIASPVGVNAQVVVPEVGLLASSVTDWLAALWELSADVDLRCRMGLAARAHVEAQYALAVVAPRIVRWFAGLAR